VVKRSEERQFKMLLVMVIQIIKCLDIPEPPSITVLLEMMLQEAHTVLLEDLDGAEVRVAVMLDFQAAMQ
jgi:hypothetical protein